MNEPLPPYRVGIVGLGLIGGSLALALRAAGFAGSVLAWDRDPEVLVEGRARAVIDGAVDSPEALLEAVDVAILAAPTLACADLLRRMLESPGRTRCVTDVASVKGPLCAVAAAMTGSRAARYVPGHPIAGSERSGVRAATPTLFEGHRVILTPADTTDGEAVVIIERMWRATGATVDHMGVAEHDAVLAATSHLPHVLAYALVDALARSPTRDDIFRFAAGGFRDFTRIASSDPVMWRDIALANREALLAALDDFGSHLACLRRAIEDGDGAALENTFRAAKEARDAFARDLARREAGRLAAVTVDRTDVCQGGN
jgi:3-phosphoshikimate 1-carboxyvinyltransferase